MNALHAALACALFTLAGSSAFGQSSGWRDALRSDPRFRYGSEQIPGGTFVKRADLELSTAIRSLELHLAKAKESEPQDFLSKGIRSIEGNFDSPDFLTKGLYLRHDDDSSIRLRSKVSYTYSPRQLPNDPFVVFDKMFILPIRMVVMKTLSF
ncbi:MAG: hypothetical protein HZA81_00505 [Candidatus Taylorbacteria bacterium]|nr:hypothetical protein [Candidatus Taylorbacteria bacterium]